jgi:hypothetical protein
MTGGHPYPGRTLAIVRDRETIDSVLRLIAAVRRQIREHGGELIAVSRCVIKERHAGSEPVAASRTLTDTSPNYVNRF